MRRFNVMIVVLLSLVALPTPLFGQDTDKAPLTKQTLWQAAQQGDLSTLKKCIESGIDVDVKTEYGATALFYACDRGNAQVVEYLLKNGASVDIKDSFYNATPLTWAMSKGHDEIVVLLAGAKGADIDSILKQAVQSRREKLVESILETGKVSADGKTAAQALARSMRLSKVLLALGDNKPLEAAVDEEEVKVSEEVLKKYLGTYKGPTDIEVKIEAEEGKLVVIANGNSIPLNAKSETEFEIGTIRVAFDQGDEKVAGFVWKQGENESRFVRVPVEKSDDKEAETAEPRFRPSSEASRMADLAVSSANWPSFRGNGARGIADGQQPPVKWDATNSSNLKWKTPIPGLAHSCPVIWGDRIYLTSAISEADDGELKIGNYGDVDSVEDQSIHRFVVYCLDKSSGQILWEQVANRTVPKVKRHLKSTHANSTPATNGQYVVAFFGSEGLYCFQNDGSLVWQKQLGTLNSGWFYDAGYQWGFGSSPIIFEDKVIVQCDIQDQSFLACFKIENGEEIWRVEREEIPSWASPTVVPSRLGPVIVTNATKFVRANLVADGTEVWRLGNNSEIAVPTPFFAHNRVFISSGYRPIQPIYVVDPDAEGDITLEGQDLSNQYIDWSTKRGGPYMPSPICYGDYLYTCSNSGILACLEAKTGREVYRKRLSAPGGALSFVGSPIAADMHLYLPAEDGRVLVVKAGPEFELISVNPVGEYILTTPAVSEKAIYIRAQKHIYAFENANSSDQ
jgi:outer membrane protein assembly factor BamB